MNELTIKSEPSKESQKSGIQTTAYKQTEVGLIPNDWEVKTISEISNPVRGGSPRTAGDPKYFKDNFIPWLTVAALTNIPLAQMYFLETDSYLTKEGLWAPLKTSQTRLAHFITP